MDLFLFVCEYITLVSKYHSFLDILNRASALIRNFSIILKKSTHFCSLFNMVPW
jgi:hypothetical protein